MQFFFKNTDIFDYIFYDCKVEAPSLKSIAFVVANPFFSSNFSMIWIQSQKMLETFLYTDY